MPMMDYSTLIYFVNNIQSEFESETKPMDLEPSDQCVKNILDFARSYDVFETELTGHVEMNLN
ncbi:hypothetical protein [uncultured Draconibacterium sp.]|uniref:hypothetical protein n=1 Tax=uncultured Draconibacterium sp. TaxID=1573823 RepID=UPI0032603D7B